MCFAFYNLILFVLFLITIFILVAGIDYQIKESKPGYKPFRVYRNGQSLRGNRRQPNVVCRVECKCSADKQQCIGGAR